MLPRLVLAAFLLGHAAIHAGYSVAAPGGHGRRSALALRPDALLIPSPFGVGSETLRVLGFALFALTLASFALAAIAAVGFLPAGVWGWSTVIGAAASLAMPIVFFHPWLVVGIAIDVLALWTVLAIGWTPTDTVVVTGPEDDPSGPLATRVGSSGTVVRSGTDRRSGIHRRGRWIRPADWRTPCDPAYAPRSTDHSPCCSASSSACSCWLRWPLPPTKRLARAGSSSRPGMSPCPQATRPIWSS